MTYNEALHAENQACGLFSGELSVLQREQMTGKTPSDGGIRISCRSPFRD